MLESLIIMLREGIEAALVIGMVLVVLKRSDRRDLERVVFWGVGVAVGASIVAAVALQRLPINEEAYEGVLYWVSAVFVASMMVWMHRRARTLRSDIEGRVRTVVESRRGAREAWGLGAFTFLMIFREGAETVLFLSAVNLTTDALLSLTGALLGLTGAVVFCVLFVRGSLHVNLRRFFTVTEWVLGIFVLQLVVNGYHEFSEAGLLPATRETMAVVGPMVRNNSLFLLAIVAIPLFIWISGRREPVTGTDGTSDAQRRLALAAARRDRTYRLSAVCAAIAVVVVVGVAYARDRMPRTIPAPEAALVENGEAVLPIEMLEDGNLHRLGVLVDGRLVRFLALKTTDGKVRSTLDACEICGPLGYVQDGRNLLCVNCAAEINPLSLGTPGGCNPIPLTATVDGDTLRVSLGRLRDAAPLFDEASGAEHVDPVCGMRVATNRAAAFAKAGGSVYYFCSTRCEELFHADPAAYAAR